MLLSRFRRPLTLVATAALLASLAAATVAAPVSAAKPKCQGKTATIVGTKKADIIRGTRKRDIIVARGGADRIYAKGGNDLVCAGPGNDRVFGGPGADRLWGQFGHDRLNGNAGPDFVAGQVGNDTLNGGIGVDTCFQGTGSGPVTRCERPAPPPPAPPPPPPPPPAPPPPPPSADLVVDVTGPSFVNNQGSELYAVTVSNEGPEPSAYSLTHSLEASREVCSVTQDPSGQKALLQPGEMALWTYEISCGINSVNVTFTAGVETVGGPVDPFPKDNTDSQETIWTKLT